MHSATFGIRCVRCSKLRRLILHRMTKNSWPRDGGMKVLLGPIWKVKQVKAEGGVTEGDGGINETTW